ncbi:sensor histidine kinase [Mucilaginibacter jinjuensis]|uniref:histidine kinase n=1 Tax=Mucilaginibacter jinjuensis TaxID=1176721 RepID=A0ABY7T7C0_9SPHI|nr:sensor histidine kinase [Mucilaginibacter jinjuensis]WCT12257.1 sensor histidine kinase [Mucilaginibacter jinjuensis]
MSDGLDFGVLLAVATGILLLFVLFIVVILFIYQRKTFEHQQKVVAIEQNLKQEILKTQIEVQDQTLTYVSREIHDNITQVLSFVKLSLGVVGKDAEQTQAKITESRELLSQAINDLRDLSKSMSFDTIKAAGLEKTITLELERINKSGLVKAELNVEGEPFSLGEKNELVLFRIFQETVNNALKHANAQQLKIELLYSPKVFNLTIADDGVGFPTSILDEHRGSGLKNLQNRAALIGGTATITSSPGNGCSVKITLDPLLEHTYANADYSNSPG